MLVGTLVSERAIEALDEYVLGGPGAGQMRKARDLSGPRFFVRLREERWCSEEHHEAHTMADLLVDVTFVREHFAAVFDVYA